LGNWDARFLGEGRRQLRLLTRPYRGLKKGDLLRKRAKNWEAVRYTERLDRVLFPPPTSCAKSVVRTQDIEEHTSHLQVRPHCPCPQTVTLPLRSLKVRDNYVILDTGSRCMGFLPTVGRTDRRNAWSRLHPPPRWRVHSLVTASQK
jgi:hypothetical protein